MPGALPYIMGASAVIQGAQALSTPTPQPPPVLSMDQATAQAQATLNPFFGEQLKNALKAVDQRNIQRGFFGQLPGAALARSTAADIETRRAQAIGQLAGQLQGASADQAAQLSQLALQSQQARMAGLSSMLGGMSQIRDLWPSQWANWFPGVQNPSNTLANASTLVTQGYGRTPLTTFNTPGFVGRPTILPM